MSWQAFRLRLDLLAPLHIGWRTVGNLRRTRHYVPGRALWGAITARVARQMQVPAYDAVGEEIAKNLTFSYFYPCDCDREEEMVWPWGESQDEFSYRFLSSWVSAPQDPDKSTAQEGMLHEVEHLTPRTKDTGRQVFLHGYVFVRSGYDGRWRSELSRLRLGGEQGYGWGRVRGWCEPLAAEHHLFRQFRVELGGERPVVFPLHQEGRLPGHARASVRGILGRMELFGGRCTTAKMGTGGKLADVELCYVPGSRLEWGTTGPGLTVDSVGIIG